MAHQPGLELIEGLEEAPHGLLIGLLRCGEPRAIDPVVHILVDEGIEVVDLFPDSVLIQIDPALGEAIEFTVEHAHEVVVGIGDDALGHRIPQHRDGEPSPIVWIGGLVDLAEELKAVNGIERMARPFAECPAPLVADRVHDRHADDLFEFLEFSYNDRPMRPGAGPGDIEMVAALRRRITGTTIRGHPVPKDIRLPREGSFDTLFVWKLRLNRHRRTPAFSYRTTLKGMVGLIWLVPCARATRGLRRMGRERPGALLARRTRTMKRCSFCAQ